MFRLDNKIAIVTGAACGAGAATARILGARVALADVRSKEAQKVALENQNMKSTRLLQLTMLVLVAWVGRPAHAADLAEHGTPQAAIVVGNGNDQSANFVATELQKYLLKLSLAKLPIVTVDHVPAGGTVIVVGGPASNPLCAAAAKDGLVNFESLKPEGFILKTVELQGRPALVVGGNDDAGTMYGAYDLLERLGVVFTIYHDVIPEQKSVLALPELDVRQEPLAKYRGAMKEEAEGNWYMGLREWDSLLDQMAKLKMNTLQLWISIGSPWWKITYNGKVGELLGTPESGYLAWGTTSRSWGRSPHCTTGAAKDVIVGREVFPSDYIGAPEFARVRTPDEAFRAGREFTHGLIRHAHSRHIQVWLMPAEMSFLPPNLSDYTPKQREEFRFKYQYQRFCGVAGLPGDPVTLDIWEATMRSLIDTYPEADCYGFWTAEHSPELSDDRVNAILRKYADKRAMLPTMDEIRRRGNVQESWSNATELLDGDFMQIYLSAMVIERMKRDYPHARFAVETLFRGYMLPVLDAWLPKDVVIGNMEECSTTKSVMDFYANMPGRDLIVCPRISDDGDDYHVQLNPGEFDRDEIISGTVKYGLSGVVGYSGQTRNETYNYAYIAEGGWNPKITAGSFYEDYLKRLYGPAALEPLRSAFKLLEENEFAVVYWGRSEIFMAFEDWSPLEKLRTNVNYRADPVTVNLSGFKRIDVAANETMVKGTAVLTAGELKKAIHSTWNDSKFWSSRQALVPQHEADVKMTNGEYFESRAEECRQALGFLRAARDKVLPGSRGELEYMIYKTDTLVQYFEVLKACYESTVALDRAWLGLVENKWTEFGIRLKECQEDLARADRLAGADAAAMIAYADVPEEKYLLFRYNREVIQSIEKAQRYVEQVASFYYYSRDERSE